MKPKGFAKINIISNYTKSNHLDILVNQTAIITFLIAHLFV